MHRSLLLLLLMGQCFYVMCVDSECEIKLIEQKKTWEEALDHCRKHHYDLVSITNKTQLGWVKDKVNGAVRANKNITDFIWLGLRYTCTLDIWFWVNGEVLDHHIGDSPLSPNCTFAAAMKRETNEWSKQNDDQKFNFICVEKCSTNPSPES